MSRTSLISLLECRPVSSLTFSLWWSSYESFFSRIGKLQKICTHAFSLLLVGHRSLGAQQAKLLLTLVPRQAPASLSRIVQSPGTSANLIALKRICIVDDGCSTRRNRARRQPRRKRANKALFPNCGDFCCRSRTQRR